MMIFVTKLEVQLKDMLKNNYHISGSDALGKGMYDLNKKYTSIIKICYIIY